MVHTCTYACTCVPFCMQCLPIFKVCPSGYVSIFFHFQTDMVDLNQIMRDMATIVVEQGDTIGGWATYLTMVEGCVCCHSHTHKGGGVLTSKHQTLLDVLYDLPTCGHHQKVFCFRCYRRQCGQCCQFGGEGNQKPTKSIQIQGDALCV